MEWRNLPPIRNRIERRLVFSPPFEGGVGGVLVTSINPTLIPAVILTDRPRDGRATVSLLIQNLPHFLRERIRCERLLQEGNIGL
jgi:hypothetical protein